MARGFEVKFLKKAGDFLNSLDKKASGKIIANIRKCAEIFAEGKRDETLFKKVSDEGIWEFRTLYNGNAYRLFAFLGREPQGFRSGDARHSQEDAENTEARD